MATMEHLAGWKEQDLEAMEALEDVVDVVPLVSGRQCVNHEHWVTHSV